MGDNLQNAARRISARLQQLEADYWGTATGAFLVLEQLDPEMAWLAVEAAGDRDTAARWFSSHIGSLYCKTPWECLAAGDEHSVRRALNTFIKGLPP